MNQLDILQYGYIGLIGLMIIIGGQSVKTYLNNENPPKHSVLIISLFFMLVVAGGIFGFLWAEKELESTQSKEAIVSIINKQIITARRRLDESVTALHSARAKALEESVDNSNLDKLQEKNRNQAKVITEMIELQEERYAKELVNIAEAFSAINAKTE